MTCNCISQIDEMLKEHNTCLVPAMTNLFGPGPMTLRALLQTEKIDGKARGKAKSMIATFCPFCGVAYEPQPAIPGGEPQTASVPAAVTPPATIDAPTPDRAGVRATTGRSQGARAAAPPGDRP